MPNPVALYDQWISLYDLQISFNDRTHNGLRVNLGAEPALPE
jgi:hypothetical protein